MIHLKQVSKRFHDKPILSAVSLCLDAEKTHVLLGASGSGKTTILRMIAGTLAPDEGVVTVDGAQVAVQDPCPLASILGYMTQEGGLFPHLSAGQNVTLMAEVSGWEQRRIRARLEEVSALVGLKESLLARY